MFMGTKTKLKPPPRFAFCFFSRVFFWFAAKGHGSLFLVHGSPTKTRHIKIHLEVTKKTPSPNVGLKMKGPTIYSRKMTPRRFPEGFCWNDWNTFTISLNKYHLGLFEGVGPLKFIRISSTKNTKPNQIRETTETILMEYVFWILCLIGFSHTLGFSKQNSSNNTKSSASRPPVRLAQCSHWAHPSCFLQFLFCKKESHLHGWEAAAEN